MSQPFDIVVIGAGPGGYIAAIRAAQLGFNVACVDDWTRAGGKPAPGGACTNVGCIPSKALLQSSENFERAGHSFADHGIAIDGLAIDVAKMLARKDRIVAQNNDGILFLFRKNKVTLFQGRGRIAGRDGERWTVAVDGPGAAELAATHVIVATGSLPRALPGIVFDNLRVLDNAGALAIAAVPKRLGVIGAGVIGLELGSVWRRLGAEVTILEALPGLLPAADEAVAKEALRAFTRQGLAMRFGVTVGGVDVRSDGVDVAWRDADGTDHRDGFDRLIVSIGRVPTTAGLGATDIGLALDARGFVDVDAECRTNLPNVWAIGDVVRGPMLAHKAEEEGVAVAERIAGQHPDVDFGTVPWVIYTSPEIAWVGRSERELSGSGVDVRAGSFPFSANARARAIGETTGFVKIVADAATDRVLGMHVVGPMAGELVEEGVVAMEFGAASEDLARICHAHPTLSEATHEAALAVDRRSLNA